MPARNAIGIVVLAALLLTASPAALRGQTEAEIIAREPQAISPQELLGQEMFPDSQYGMAVESATDGDVATVTTTGAEFRIDRKADQIECAQRIAAQRAVALLKLPQGSLRDLKLSHQSPGAAIYTGGGTTVRINGDSLLMVSPGSDGDIRAELRFTPDYHSDFKGNFNFFDPLGGVSFYEHGKHPDAVFRADSDPVSVTWQWKAGDVFWAGVSPPKPYDWAESIDHRVILHGSSFDRYMYPSDLSIVRWSKFGNVLMLHNENMWRGWQTDLVPRNMEGYQRVMRTAHESGMKTAVYAGPKHFLKGTMAESRATVDVNDPKSTGWWTGANARLFIQQAGRIVKEFETDGLYFDEMYCSRHVLATNYYVARVSRRLVGDEGPLYFHCTEDVLGDRQHGEKFGRTHCPTIHAYFTMLVKGEAASDQRDPAYLRYILGTYNLSNSMSGQIYDDRVRLTPELLEVWFRRANIRLFFPESQFFSEGVEIFRHHYWPRLTPTLREQIEPDLLRPTGTFEQYRQSIRDSLR